MLSSKVTQALCCLGLLALVNSLEHERQKRHGVGELLAEVTGKANVVVQSQEKGPKVLRLKGSSALRQLGSQQRPGCHHLTNLVHTLQRSRANVSTEEMPLSYMRVDHPVHQVALATFDLWNDPNEVLEALDEDARALLQPFLQDVSRWREVRAGSLCTCGTAAHAPCGLWSEDKTPLAELLSKDKGCFESVAVLSGEPWSFAWAQHFRCNVQEGRLVLRFVEHFMQHNFVEQSNASDDARAKVCLSKGNPQLLKPLELCDLRGRPVQLKVAPTAVDMAQCDAFLTLPSTTLTGTEFWLREASSLVEILPNNKRPRIVMENLALLTGAKRFTLRSLQSKDDELSQFDDFNENVLEAERAILALNRAGFDAVDGSLDDGIAGVGDLEGCEEFYNPKDGWKEGWRDVARSLKLPRKGESIGVTKRERPENVEVIDDDSEGDTSQTAISEEDSESEETQIAQNLTLRKMTKTKAAQPRVMKQTFALPVVVALNVEVPRSPKEVASHEGQSPDKVGRTVFEALRAGTTWTSVVKRRSQFAWGGPVGGAKPWNHEMNCQMNP
eukprot:s1473_g10.t1